MDQFLLPTSRWPFTSLLCWHFGGIVSCLTTVTEAIPFTYLHPMLDSDPVFRTHVSTVLLCFWYQDILTTPSHSSSYHGTNPSRSFQMSLPPSAFIIQSPEGTLSFVWSPQHSVFTSLGHMRPLRWPQSYSVHRVLELGTASTSPPVATEDCT